MSLQHAVSSTDYSKSPLARDIKTCENAWNWLKEKTVSEKLKRAEFFIVSLDDFPEFCKEALTHSLICLPHRDPTRYGNLASELIVAANALGDNVEAESIATLLLSYCGEENPSKYIQSLTLLIYRRNEKENSQTTV